MFPRLAGNATRVWASHGRVRSTGSLRRAWVQQYDPMLTRYFCTQLRMDPLYPEADTLDKVEAEAALLDSLVEGKEGKTLPPLSDDPTALYRIKDIPEGIYFDESVGRLPCPYDPTEPLPALFQAHEAGQLESNGVRTFLRLLRKRDHVDEAMVALKFAIKENYLLDSHFFDSFIRGLLPSHPSHAYEAYYLMLEAKQASPVLLKNVEQMAKGASAADKLSEQLEIALARSELTLHPRLYERLFRALMNASLESNNDALAKQAVSLFQAAPAAGRARLDASDYQFVIYHLLQAGDLNDALEVHNIMHTSGVQMNSHIGFALMEACYQANRPQSALNIYDMAYPVPLTYKYQIEHTDSLPMLHLALYICDQYNLIGRAALIYNRCRLELDTPTYELVLSIFSRDPSLAKECQAIAQDMKRKGDMTLFGAVDDGQTESPWTKSTYDALIHAADNIRTLDSLVRDMKNDSRIQPDITTYNLRLKKLTQLGQNERIEHVMNEMQNAHIASNQDTANLRLRAALDDGEESGDYATAVPLFQELVQGGQLSLGGVLSVMELMLAEKISQEQVDTLLSAQPSSSAGEQTFSSVALMSANAQRLIELAVRAGVKPTPALFYPVIQGATKDVKEQITNELQEAGVLPRTESEDVWAVEAINNPDPSHIRIVNRKEATRQQVERQDRTAMAARAGRAKIDLDDLPDWAKEDLMDSDLQDIDTHDDEDYEEEFGSKKGKKEKQDSLDDLF